MTKIIPAVLAIILSTSVFAEKSDPISKPHLKTFVMGPLEPITDWVRFKKQLEILKDSGIEGITTDVWWGIVEPKEGEFNWEYYRHYAEVVRETGLQWIPILSFHKVGETVGDNVTINLPDWVWRKFPDMKFISSDGFSSTEYISFWAHEAHDLYSKFMHAFATEFAPYKSMIAKVYIGMGPAGELRYPSYNYYAGWRYPEIGTLQAYSGRAKNSFRRYLKDKYHTIEALNNAWQLKFGSFTDENILPPMDGIEFFRQGWKTQYGKDFLDWYQDTLENHLDTMLRLAHDYLDQLLQAPLGIKIAGVHWRMGDPKFPHSAEYAAGYYNYDRIIRIFAKHGAELTFTCIEMSDNNTFPTYSMPRYLIDTIGGLARRYSVPWWGENALALQDKAAEYRYVREVLNRAGVTGFTLLRLSNIFPEKDKLPARIALRDVLLGRKHQAFVVRLTPDQSREVRRRNYELRIVGNNPLVGDGDPKRGLSLYYKPEGEWKATIEVTEPENLRYHVVLYHRAKNRVIAELGPARLLSEDTDIETIWPRFPDDVLKSNGIENCRSVLKSF